MFAARPVYNVFVVDRFETVAANQVDAIAREGDHVEFKALPLTGPKVIAARQPTDSKGQTEIIFRRGGRFANLPESYVPTKGSAARHARAARGACQANPGAAASGAFLAALRAPGRRGRVPADGRARS